MTSHPTPSGSTQRASTAGNVAVSPGVPPAATPAVSVIETDTVREGRSGGGYKMVNQYEMITQLGKGQHGEVWYSRSTITSEVVAIKAMKRKNPKQDRMSLLRKPRLPRTPQHMSLANNMSATEIKIMKEIAIMKKLRHPHVVQLLEVLNDNLKEKIYMVMEFMDGGEIKWRTDSEDPLLRVSQTRRICRDVLLGLEYLHNQGIIHRDIKPANLLWSADRRVVKIADFGISHFSYAQFLAAKGNSTNAAGDGARQEHDKILMDESDLTRFAGTPTFLAPEILAEGSADLSNSSTATNLQTVDSLTAESRKPTITKAIDIWAFGVTLYAFLFGKLPFVADGEYAIYIKIKEDDFDVPELMGLDKIPVGGRRQKRPKKGLETDGYLVVDLLQGLLEKNPNKRLTLEGVKHHPWMVRDMPNAHLWLRTTGPPGESNSLAPTEDETSSALSTVLFRYSFRNRFAKNISSGITTFIRNIRPQRSFRNPTRAEKQAISEEEQRYRRIGTRSMPHVELSSRQGSSTTALDKGKQPVRPQNTRNKSSIDIRTAQGTKSLDWASTQSGGFNTPGVGGSGSKPRRGSAPGHARANLESLRVSEQPPRVTPTASQRSPSFQSPCQTPSSPQTSELPQEPDRPRSRLSVLVRWLANKPQSWAPSHQPSSSSLPSSAASPVSAVSSAGPGRLLPARDLSSRRSEDAFTRIASRSVDGSFTQAMRAASWGEVGGWGARPSEDMTSLYSDHGEDGPDEDTYLVGFGGVAQSPVSTIPSAVLSTVSSLGSMAPAPVPISAAQVLLGLRDAGRVDPAEPPSHVDPATQDTGNLARQAQYRAHATSPLSQPASSEALDVQHAPTFDDSDSSDDSGERTPSEADFATDPRNTSRMYQEEDEDSEDEEAVPLEVRTRRPSNTLHSRPTSPRRPSVPQEGRPRPVVHI